MTEMKEQAITLILRMPDEQMSYVMEVLTNVESMATQGQRTDKLKPFFSLAGKVQIDPKAIDHLRKESMI